MLNLTIKLHTLADSVKDFARIEEKLSLCVGLMNNAQYV